MQKAIQHSRETAVTNAPTPAQPARTRDHGPADARYGGNQAALRRLSRTIPGLQCKLEIGAADDPLEAEADRVADQVMRMPDPGISLSSPPRISRKCQECEEEDKHRQTVFTKRAGSAATPPTAVPAPVYRVLNSPGEPLAPHARQILEPRMVRRECDACDDDEIASGCSACSDDIGTVQPKLIRRASPSGDAPSIVYDVLRSPGQPLDRDARGFFEQRFGYDFGGVRVHTGSVAAQSAAAIGAHAYTLGSDIVFGDGRFDPSSQLGRELLAHELTHVVQQSEGPKVISRDDTSGSAPAQPQAGTPSDGVRALASLFETYATQGEAALAHAAIDAGDADRIRGNLTSLRTAIAGMRTVAGKGDDTVSVALLASFRSDRLKKAAASLQRAVPARVTVLETQPQEVAAFSPGAAGESAMEREAQQIANIVGSVSPSLGGSSPGGVVRRQPAEVLQQVEQQAPVIDQLIDVSAIGLGLGAAANDTVAVGVVAAALGSPVVVVAAIVVVAVLAVAAVWYFWRQGLSEETKKVEDVPPQTGSPAPASVATPPPPPVPVAVRPGRDRWKTTVDPATGTFFSSEAAYNKVPRNAGQTCENSRLDEMESDMHRICDESGKWSCSDAVEKIGKKNQKLLDCPELMKHITIGEACLKAQTDLQTECFGGAPDPVHAAKIQAYQAVLNLCKQKLATRFPSGCP